MGSARWSAEVGKEGRLDTDYIGGQAAAEGGGVLFL